MIRTIEDIQTLVMECQQDDGECKCGDDMIICQQIGYVLDALYCRNAQASVRIVSQTLNNLCSKLTKPCESVNRLIGRTQMHSTKYIDTFTSNFHLDNLGALVTVAQSRIAAKNIWHGCLNVCHRKELTPNAEKAVISCLLEQSDRCLQLYASMLPTQTYTLNGCAGILLLFLSRNQYAKDKFLAKYSRDDEFWGRIRAIGNPTLNKYTNALLA